MASSTRKAVTVEELAQLEAQAEAEAEAREADESMGQEPAASAPAVALTFEQLKELLAMNAVNPAQIAKIAAEAATEGARAVKMPENKQPPGVSAFNPDGERDHPRPKVKCYVYFGSAPIGSPKDNRTVTREEIDALNTLTPGHFRITKMDQSQVVVELRGQVNSNRVLERLWIVLPDGDEQKNLYPPLTDFCRQCCEANRVQELMIA